MSGEVIGLKRGARWIKVTERAVRCGWLDQAAWGRCKYHGGFRGSRMEKLADMEKVVDQPTRGEAGDCFAQMKTAL